VDSLQATATPSPEDAPIDAPDRVDVEPTARDDEIRQRLQDILEATGWFTNPDVRVQDGVVFLSGQTEDDEYRTWAGDLARSTQDVAAVVNQIEVLEPSIWDFQPVLNGLREQARRLVRALPIIGIGLLILIAAWFLARFTIRNTSISLEHRNVSPLLRSVLARGAGVLVFLLGLYLVFSVAGLTSVALTVLGGTGLLGIAIGIAFRDIAENFLASVFLSVQSPFRTGDLVEIGGTEGFVQTLTTRTTVLMTPDGDLVQIPNATVYKSVIYNYTSSPNRREDFIVGIGYDDAVTEAQEVALNVLAEHPAILEDPEPLVLVENLGTATVDLHIYFWFDGSQHSPFKVKSSVIRLVKLAFQESGISMPGEQRELIISHEVPLRLLESQAPDGDGGPRPHAHESAAISTGAEGGLRSEAKEIEKQARQSRLPEEGQNLLESPPPDDS
jgi:small-conductance mechanosensitive channel